MSNMHGMLQSVVGCSTFQFPRTRIWKELGLSGPSVGDGPETDHRRRSFYRLHPFDPPKVAMGASSPTPDAHPDKED